MNTYADSLIEVETKRPCWWLLWLRLVLNRSQTNFYTGEIYLAWRESTDKWIPDFIKSTLSLVAGLNQKKQYLADGDLLNILGLERLSWDTGSLDVTQGRVGVQVVALTKPLEKQGQGQMG